MSELSEENSHQLLTRFILENALKNDLGSEWSLVDYEIKDFTKKGDNYACKVTGVRCKASLDNEEKDTFYVAKLNPLHTVPMLDNHVSSLFVREAGFLRDVAPQLNMILKNEYNEIGFPQCVYAFMENRKQVIITKDLRQKEYKMYDRMIGMDYSHADMVVRELAKLHTTSIMFQEDLKEKRPILELFPFMYDKWLTKDSISRQMYEKAISMTLEACAKMIKQVKGYEKHCQWLENFIQNGGMDTYCEMILNASDNMKVICHGDCWSNNLLFKYMDDYPCECALIDFQACKYGSLGLDLNFFFYTSLTREDRKKHKDDLISAYFDECHKIEVQLRRTSTLKFVEIDIKDEIKRTALFGIISALTILPLVIREKEDIPELNEMKGHSMEEFIEDYTKCMSKMAEDNPVFITRFLGVFDDLTDLGFI